MATNQQWDVFRSAAGTLLVRLLCDDKEIDFKPSCAERASEGWRARQEADALRRDRVGRGQSVAHARLQVRAANRKRDDVCGGKLPESESALNRRRSRVDDDCARGDGGIFRDQAGEIRSLRPSRSDRRGRDGGGVPGGDARRGGVPADVRRQANPGRAGAVAVLRRHVRPGGAHQRAPAPPEHRAGVRLRQRRRHLLPGDGVRARARRLGDSEAPARSGTSLPGGRWRRSSRARWRRRWPTPTRWPPRTAPRSTSSTATSAPPTSCACGRAG